MKKKTHRPSTLIEHARDRDCKWPVTEEEIVAAAKAERSRKGPRRDARGRFRRVTTAEMFAIFREPSPLLAALPWKRVRRFRYGYHVRTKLPGL